MEDFDKLDERIEMARNKKSLRLIVKKARNNYKAISNNPYYSNATKRHAKSRYNAIVKKTKVKMREV
jgi:hypothetical protein